MERLGCSLPGVCLCLSLNSLSHFLQLLTRTNQKIISDVIETNESVFYLALLKIPSTPSCEHCRIKALCCHVSWQMRTWRRPVFCIVPLTEELCVWLWIVKQRQSLCYCRHFMVIYRKLLFLFCSPWMTPVFPPQVLLPEAAHHSVNMNQVINLLSWMFTEGMRSSALLEGTTAGVVTFGQ